MKNLSISDIRALQPYYDPKRHLAEDWEGTIIDLLKRDDIPAEDRLWVALHKEFLTEKILRLFACRCVREVWHLLEDDRSKTAVEVAERYAVGEATAENRRRARDAAYAAYNDICGTNSAIAAAMWTAADAAGTAARSAAADVAEAAADENAAREKQVKILIEMLEEDEKTINSNAAA